MQYHDAVGIPSWIFRYYIDPIIYDTSYNPVDTVTWALMLGIMVLALARASKKFDIKFDEGLVAATMPYILAGSSLRVMEDTRIVIPPLSYLLITPIIYFLVFFVTSSSLVLTRWIWKESYLKAYAGVGTICTLANLAILFRSALENTWILVAVAAMGSAVTGLIYILKGPIPGLGFMRAKFNLAILLSHMLDASSTYVGVDWFEYREKHVVPTYLIDMAGTAAIMYPLKLMVILPILYIVDETVEDPSLRNLTKLTLITLGLAPAVRNTLRLAIGA